MVYHRDNRFLLLLYITNQWLTQEKVTKIQKDKSLDKTLISDKVEPGLH